MQPIRFATFHRILCTFGLITHFTIMTVNYLQYETTTSLYLELPQTIESQAVSICFPFNEIIDGDWIEQIYGLQTRLAIGIDSDDIGVQQVKKNMTMADIFDHTPTIDEMYGFAYVRNDQTYNVEFINGTKVRDYFVIDRYFKQAWFCYRIQTRDRKSFKYMVLATSEWMGMMYTFGIPTNISDHVSFVMPVVHAANRYPLKSFLFASQCRHYPSLNVYKVSSQKIVNEYLRYPYKTDCFDYDHIASRDNLINQCLINSTINRLAFIPYSELKTISHLKLNGNLTIKQPFDFARNRTTWIEMRKIRSFCDQLYPKLDCHDHYYMTELVEREDWRKDGLLVRVGQPLRHSIRTIYQPMQDFYTFALLVLSCFGVWLGFEPN